MIHDGEGDLAARRKRLAEEWRTAAARIEGSIPEFPRGTSIRSRLATRLTMGPREDRRRAFLHRFRTLTDELAYESVGAAPGEWGVFSGAPPDPGQYDDNDFVLVEPWGGCSLEVTLEQLTFPNEGLPEARRLLAQLPALRVAAALDGPAARERVETAVLAMTRMAEPDANRQLSEHLPLRTRPQVSALEELERRNPLVTLYVSEPPTRWRDEPANNGPITLHDVVVNRHLRGRGLGTVVLDELCRFADDTGRDIVGMLEPGPSAPASAVAPLARWYSRNGFEVHPRPISVAAGQPHDTVTQESELKTLAGGDHLVEHGGGAYASLHERSVVGMATGPPASPPDLGPIASRDGGRRQQG